MSWLRVPHNSGHLTVDASATSQFEQQLRAVCGLPLGSTALLRPAAMANLLGGLWAEGEPDWIAACAFSEVKLHLYGKLAPRPGRKMGTPHRSGAPRRSSARNRSACPKCVGRWGRSPTCHLRAS